jgi:hypothetical protein
MHVVIINVYVKILVLLPICRSHLSRSCNSFAKYNERSRSPRPTEHNTKSINEGVSHDLGQSLSVYFNPARIPNPEFTCELTSSFIIHPPSPTFYLSSIDV